MTRNPGVPVKTGTYFLIVPCFCRACPVLDTGDKSGFLLEFTLTKVGAGMTKRGFDYVLFLKGYSVTFSQKSY
jgi:hypothetical protein